MNNPNLVAYIERETKERNLANKPWKEVVDNIILPKMAGKSNRWCINDKFMLLMSFHYHDIMVENVSLFSILQQIALQRISCGAVRHEYVEDMAPLPKEYREYSSIYDENHVMTEGTYEYLMSGSFEWCFRDEKNKSHASKIAFGLIHHISPEGEIAWNYVFPSEFKCRGINLYTKACYLVEKNCDYDTIFENYTKEGQWAKHKLWFAENHRKINWKQFFDNSKAVSGNWFQRIIQKRRIKKEIYRLSLSVAGR